MLGGCVCICIHMHTYILFHISCPPSMTSDFIVKALSIKSRYDIKNGLQIFVQCLDNKMCPLVHVSQ